MEDLDGMLTRLITMSLTRSLPRKCSREWCWSETKMKELPVTPCVLHDRDRDFPSNGGLR
jgi:hypothetical protein